MSMKTLEISCELGLPEIAKEWVIWCPSGNFKEFRINEIGGRVVVIVEDLNTNRIIGLWVVPSM